MLTSPILSLQSPSTLLSLAFCVCLCGPPLSPPSSTPLDRLDASLSARFRCMIAQMRTMDSHRPSFDWRHQTMAKGLLMSSLYPLPFRPASANLQSWLPHHQPARLAALLAARCPRTSSSGPATMKATRLREAQPPVSWTLIPSPRAVPCLRKTSQPIASQSNSRKLLPGHRLGGVAVRPLPFQVRHRHTSLGQMISSRVSASPAHLGHYPILPLAHLLPSSPSSA